MDARDAYDVINLLREILDEIRAMRKDYNEGQAVYAANVESLIAAADGVCFNYSYE
jgi:hypothetical protein